MPSMCRSLVLVSLVAASPLHATTPAPQQTPDSYAQPGERVTIAPGRTLNLRCSGKGPRMVLLEAGGNDDWIWYHVPVGYLYTNNNPRSDWCFRTAPEPALGGRSLPYPRGKVVGGSSAINAMIYIRGQAADYDHWRQLGLEGWGWDDVLPYFMKSEDHHGGRTALHGSGGEWKVARQRLTWDILKAVQEGAKEFGIMPRADFNDGSNEGSGLFEVNQHGGIRWNTAKGFLRRP